MIHFAREQSLGNMLRRSALRHGSRSAIVCGTVEWTYREFDALVDRLAAGLATQGIEPGDRVAILARNSHAYMAIRFAVARAGAVLVPINFMLRPEDVRYILEHSGSRMLAVDAELLETAKAAASDIPLIGIADESGTVPDAPGILSWETLAAAGTAEQRAIPPGALGQIIYTSGTESRPKGAMLTHEAVLWEYQSCIIDCEWTSDTVALHAMPLFHCAQLDAMMGPALQVGATNIIQARPAPETLLPTMERHRVTSFFAPPTVWISLLRSPLFDHHDLSTLAKGYYGASIMPVATLRELRERLPRLRLWNLYGQTEIAPLATVLFPEEHEKWPGSAGRPALHVETRVVDDDMRDVALGEIGEIVHRSPQLLTGYWRDEERTAEAFAGGWFHSGDLGVLDADGYLTVVDRKKDMIKTGGENVSSREVEELLYGHPAVSEVAVVGLPDPHWIEVVTAFIVVRAGHQASEQELLDYCREAIAGFKRPRRIILVDDLPRNASGKILKRELRERHLAQA